MTGANPTMGCFISSYRSLCKGLKREFLAEWGLNGPSFVCGRRRILDALPMGRQLFRAKTWSGSTRMSSANLRVRAKRVLQTRQM